MPDLALISLPHKADVASLVLQGSRPFPIGILVGLFLSAIFARPPSPPLPKPPPPPPRLCCEEMFLLTALARILIDTVTHNTHQGGLCLLQNGASTSGSQSRTKGSLEAEEEQKLAEAASIKRLLQQNTEEMTSVMRALNGEYIEPQPGGDLLRDGAGVLPTGKAINLNRSINQSINQPIN